MKNLILTTALVLGATAPAFAETVKAPGYANDRALAIFQAESLRQDSGDERLFGANAGHSNTNTGGVVMSSRSPVNGAAAAIFAQQALSDDEGASRRNAGASQTIVSGEPVNRIAAAIFADQAASLEHSDK